MTLGENAESLSHSHTHTVDGGITAAEPIAYH